MARWKCKHRIPSIRARPKRPAVAGLLFPTLGACLGLAACTAPGADLHFAPLYTHLSLAGGDSGIEALGGTALARWNQETDRLDYWALRPLISWQRQAENRSFAWFLPPLGQRFKRPEETVHQFLPILRHARQHPTEGPTSYQFLMLPGIYLARDADGDKKSAFFIFYGNTKNFLSFDSANWILFPLYARFSRKDRNSHHVLFPVIQWSDGTGGRSWRLWPLYGDQGIEGRYRRKFFLWPFFMWQTNDLAKQERFHQRTYFFWPFFGITEREESRSWTALWPFFGYTKDRRTGFWAWDGPWPLVVFQGGDPKRAVRKRVLPLYSYFKDRGLESRWYLWPLINLRSETYKSHDRTSVSIFPFWHAWDRVDSAGRKSSWRKLWPLIRNAQDEAGDTEMIAWPALSPLRRYAFIDEHYAWLWELYVAERSFDQVRVRSWLGLYREESDRHEHRRSISILWARRDYTQAASNVREVSLLAGLIRWRQSEQAGLQFMRPSFPGPGWPGTRVPNSKVPAGLNPGPVVSNPLNDPPAPDKEPLQGPLASAAELKDPID
ncbi:MAG TPA: hypothetical protein EYQ25_12760 [Planctomycetes bacterium]|nr:hypothetical protein [Planctomycetota bacterium]HIL37123.1 hypothetical protein [Planctomycetota bacterium]